MLRNLLLVLVASAGLGVVTANLPDVGACCKCCLAVSEEGGKDHDHDKAHADKCAKLCADCMRECEACTAHCATQAASGKKEHLKTMGFCQDCADICATSAKVLARFGPMSLACCDSCAKACDQCADSCEKTGGSDQHMVQCAKACRDCAKECRTMIKHVGH